MRRLRALALRFPGLFRTERRERELAAEMEGHLQMHIDDNLRAGMTPAQARREALLKLGGLATVEACRERNTIQFVEHLVQDTRLSLRQMRRNVGFTATAILMLALAIASCVSIFAFVDAALIKPLPYRSPARLVGVYEQHPP